MCSGSRKTILIISYPPSRQSGGADGRHPEAADGPGVHAGVQRRAQPRPRAPQEHPGQGGAEEAAALHQLAQAAGRPRGLGEVSADGGLKACRGRWSVRELLANLGRVEDVVTEKLVCRFQAGNPARLPQP